MTGARASAAEEPAGAWKWTIIVTVLAGALVFSLNSRGSVLESPVIVQAFAHAEAGATPANARVFVAYTASS